MLITDKERLASFAAPERIWQGIPSIERTGRGRMFAVFYSGNIKETLGNYVVLLTSDDDGKTWTDPAACVYTGEMSRAYDSSLWIDPKGRLWWFWSVMPVNTVWCSVCDDPDAEELKWSALRCIGGEVMMNRPIVCRDGRWLLPMAVWRDGVRNPAIEPPFGPEKLSFVYESRDEGRTFTRLGGADVPERSFDEHMLLEEKSGRLRMLVRTFYGIGESYSCDGGRSWSEGKDSGIKGPCSRFHIQRLSSGNVLLVNNDDAKVRRDLSAWISRDDGRTWLGPLLLDEREDVSYPDAVERDGRIWIIYDRDRGGFKRSAEEAEKCAREILYACVTEREIEEGKLSDPSSRLKQVISRLGKVKGSAAALYENDREFFV